MCWTCPFILAIAISGCGGRAQPTRVETFPVHGKVTFQGKPAAGFRVALFPRTEQSGPKFAPSAVTDANGEFQLQSYQPGDGAPPGEYAVTFAWPQAVSNPDPVDAPNYVDRLRGRFSDPLKSTFKVSIHEGENALPPFDLK